MLGLAAGRERSDREFDDAIYDIVFVLNASARGWILERVCREIEKASGLHCGWVFTEFNHHIDYLPPARHYFFAHYVIATHTLASHAATHRATTSVFFTHADFSRGVKAVEMLMAFEHIDHIFCMNSRDRNYLAELGVENGKLHVAIGGVDTSIFVPVDEPGPYVGFVGGYYERKRPGLMIEVIRANPATKFLLLEGHPDELTNHKILWANSPYAEQLKRLPNLTTVQAYYRDYPMWFAKMYAYISLSLLEGGPIPLLEALASGVYPIVTDTGFSRDVIGSKSSKLGRIVSTEVGVSTISHLIRGARSAGDRKRMAALARKFTWQAMANGVFDVMLGAATLGRTYPITAQSQAERWLESGWNSPDRRGAWSRQGPAIIAIPLAKGEMPRAVTFDLRNASSSTIAVEGEPPIEIDSYSARSRHTIELTSGQASSRVLRISIVGHHRAQDAGHPDASVRLYGLRLERPRSD
jgi:glycosyltransferase involved in cell wall biosynthesis